MKKKGVGNVGKQVDRREVYQAPDTDSNRY